MKFRSFDTAAQRGLHLLELSVTQGVLKLKLVVAGEAVEGFVRVVFEPKKQIAGHQPEQGRRKADGQQRLEAEAAFLQAQRFVVVLEPTAFLMGFPVLLMPVVALLQVLLGAVFSIGKGPFERSDALLLFSHQPF